MESGRVPTRTPCEVTDEEVVAVAVLVDDGLHDVILLFGKEQTSDELAGRELVELTFGITKRVEAVTSLVDADCTQSLVVSDDSSVVTHAVARISQRSHREPLLS